MRENARGFCRRGGGSSRAGRLYCTKATVHLCIPDSSFCNLHRTAMRAGSLSSTKRVRLCFLPSLSLGDDISSFGFNE